MTSVLKIAFAGSSVRMGLKERVAKDAALHGNLHDVVDAAAARTERLFLDEASGESRSDKKAQEASGNEPGAFSAHGSRSGAAAPHLMLVS